MAIIGAGYVKLTLAIRFAQKEKLVCTVDKDSDKIDNIRIFTWSSRLGILTCSNSQINHESYSPIQRGYWRSHISWKPLTKTLRKETEWSETLTAGANQVIRNSTESISKVVANLNVSEYLHDQSHFNNANAGKSIAKILLASWINPLSKYVTYPRSIAWVL